MSVHEIRHPLVQHKIGLMRSKSMSTRTFRQLAVEVGNLLTYEATQDMELETYTLDGWCGPVEAERIRGKKITVVPILRAGLGMLATGGSMVATIDLLKQAGCTSIRALVLVAAPEGIKKIQDVHPDVDIYTASVDSHLNEQGYIIPGLGDAGDKIFGTK